MAMRQVEAAIKASAITVRYTGFSQHTCGSVKRKDSKAQYPVPYQVCATVKRRCLWLLLLSSMRRSSLGEFRGDRVIGDKRGDMEDGDLRSLGRRGRSCCSRFSLRMRTRSSFKPTWSPSWSCFGGTASVSWLPPG